MEPVIIISGFEADELAAGAKERIFESKNLVLHTERCVLGEFLRAQGIPFASLDSLYETAVDFDEHILKALAFLEESFKNAGEITFCVMDTSDETAKAFVKRHPHCRVYGGGAFAALEIRSDGAYCTVNAVTALIMHLNPLMGVIVKEIDSRLLAGDVKLRLEEVYGEDANVFFRTPTGDVIALGLMSLDRLKHYDHRCACLVNPQGEPKMADFECLRLISEAKPVKDDGLSLETIAQMLAHVVQSVRAGEQRDLFTQQDVFERTADILSKGE